MARSLRQDLRERMGSSGPLPFTDFTQAALYHPSDGYYAIRVPGDVDGESFVERLGPLSDVTLAQPARELAAVVSA